MSYDDTKIQLLESYFTEKEQTIAQYGNLTASLFRYKSGVSGLRVHNGSGELVILPFQGMQIWSAEFMGRNLTMKSMFDEPRPTRQYLETYGGFLLHCGATAMGVPMAGDTHPLHGELPNAPFRDAYILTGMDKHGKYMIIGGFYQHTVAFSCNYLAEASVKVYEGSTVFTQTLEIKNLKNTDMEFMYLAHINFRPVPNGELVYSAICNPQNVRVRKSIPSHVKPKPGYAEFLQELEKHPEKHHKLSPDLVFDPEVVFSITYQADENGLAHSMQIHPDGSADYVAHYPSQLDVGVRWICITPDQQALGLVLPATAEPEGYTAEKAKGNIKIIHGGERVKLEMLIGTLSPDEAKNMKQKILKIIHV
mgnify:CR=1 FL=1